MAFIRIVRPPSVDAERYDLVGDRLRIVSDPPPGLISHAAGERGGEWQIVEVWESKEYARRFDDERLTPTIESIIGEPPAASPMESYELHQLITP
jgi:hypothetical protein